MTNQDLVEYLYTQNPDAEVTVFDGHNHYHIIDVHDTELQCSLMGDEED